MDWGGVWMEWAFRLQVQLTLESERWCFARCSSPVRHPSWITNYPTLSTIIAHWREKSLVTRAMATLVFPIWKQRENRRLICWIVWKEGQKRVKGRGGPTRNSFVIHFFARHRFFHASLKSFSEDAARTSGHFSAMLVVTALPHLVGNLRCLAAHIIERGIEWQVRVVMRELLPESAGMCRHPALHKVTSFKDLLQTQLQYR